MKSGDYVDLYGNTISLANLDAEERSLVAQLRRRARTKPSWCDFNNDAMRVVGEFYDARRVSRRKASQTSAFRIALDLGNRLGIAQGKVSPPSYRGELRHLILQFPSRRAFCKATGISQDMLSHVLAGRKDLSLESLSKALERIGYRLRIVPAAAKAKRTG
jgi:hypothetical protein